MLRKLSRYLGHNILGLLALFVALGGTAYAVNTVNSSDIVDGQVKSVDVGQNEIGSADVKDNSLNTFDVHSFLGVDVVDNSLTGADVGDGSLTGADIGDGSLTDNDVAQGAYVDFQAAIGTVPAQTCESRQITGIFANLNHLVLTPSFNTVDDNLSYTIEYSDVNNSAWMKICNPTASPITDTTSYFNLLVIQN